MSFVERIPERLSATSQRRRESQHKRRQSRFLRGPIPIIWLARAGELPGAAAMVGLAIWFSSGCQKRRHGLVICNKLLAQFRVSRTAGYRGLRALEQADLITVERHRGRCPRVAICEAAGS